MSTPAADPVPAVQPVLCLPYPHVVYPSMVASVTLPQSQVLGLLRTALAQLRSDAQAGVERDDKTPVVLACVPVADAQSDAARQAPANAPSMDACATWGCAARVERLVTHPRAEQCTLLLRGLVRVHVTSTHAAPAAPRAVVSVPPVLLARVDVPRSADDTVAVAPLAGVARELVVALGEPARDDASASAPSMLARVPLLPPTLVKKLLALLDGPDAPPAAELADVLMGVLGGVCAWHERVHHLALVEPRERVDATVAQLQAGLERVRMLRDVLRNVSQPLQAPYQRELARAQIESMAAQLALSSLGGVRVQLTELPAKAPASTSSSRALVPRAPRGTPTRADARSGRALPRDQHEDDDEDDEGEDEVAALRARLDAATGLPDEVRRVCAQELRRLGRMPPQGMERGILINYLETMLDMPWGRVAADLEPAERARLVPRSLAAVPSNLSLVERARHVLEADHYGLDKVKKRLLEYLAVLELKTEQAAAAAAAAQAADAAPPAVEPTGTIEPVQGAAAEARPAQAPAPPARAAYRGPILLLVGPPGTGKTSIARSLATALDRPFVRLSLGGVRDEAEIRGHRRTYVGALPGSVVASLRKARACDCVMLLDELDKLNHGLSAHGDPTAAMLEVLDPEQNFQFKDHYLNVPVDLSRVVFVATANSLDPIPEPLLDRVEVVPIAGYTADEKVAIAQRHLVPKLLDSHGLVPAQLDLSEELLRVVALSYTREAGVRTMERRLGDVVRAKAVEYAAARHDPQAAYDAHVSRADLERILGAPSYEPEVADDVGVPGVATGLAYQGSGQGGILHIECAFLPPGRAKLTLTGSLGDVIKESAELAFAWVKTHAFALGITDARDAPFPPHDVHLHMPSGATPKDGPSAGVAFVCALVSLYLHVPIDTRLAMTGEVTLRGHVSPVGGIKEKVLGAHRAGIDKVVLPLRNQREFDMDVPKQVVDDIRVVYVRTIQEALHAVFGASLESHLALRLGADEGRRRLQELDSASHL